MSAKGGKRTLGNSFPRRMSNARRDYLRELASSRRKKALVAIISTPAKVTPQAAKEPVSKPIIPNMRVVNAPTTSPLFSCFDCAAVKIRLLRPTSWLTRRRTFAVKADRPQWVGSGP